MIALGNDILDYKAVEDKLSSKVIVEKSKKYEDKFIKFRLTIADGNAVILDCTVTGIDSIYSSKMFTACDSNYFKDMRSLFNLICIVMKDFMGCEILDKIYSNKVEFKKF